MDKKNGRNAYSLNLARGLGSCKQNAVADKSNIERAAGCILAPKRIQAEIE